MAMQGNFRGRENRLCRATHRASFESRPLRASSAFPSLTGSMPSPLGLRPASKPSGALERLLINV